MSKTFLLPAIHLSQTVRIHPNLFSIIIVFVYTQLNVKIVQFKTIQFNVCSVSMSKTVQFQTIKFNTSRQFKCNYIEMFLTIKLFQIIQFSQTVLIQTVQLSIKTASFQIIQFSISTQFKCENIIFQAIQFSINTQFSSV